VEGSGAGLELPSNQSPQLVTMLSERWLDESPLVRKEALRTLSTLAESYPNASAGTSAATSGERTPIQSEFVLG